MSRSTDAVLTVFGSAWRAARNNDSLSELHVESSEIGGRKRRGMASSVKLLRRRLPANKRRSSIPRTPVVEGAIARTVLGAVEAKNLTSDVDARKRTIVGIT